MKTLNNVVLACLSLVACACGEEPSPRDNVLKGVQQPEYAFEAVPDIVGLSVIQSTVDDTVALAGFYAQPAQLGTGPVLGSCAVNDGPPQGLLELLGLDIEAFDRDMGGNVYLTFGDRRLDLQPADELPFIETEANFYYGWESDTMLGLALDFHAEQSLEIELESLPEIAHMPDSPVDIVLPETVDLATGEIPASGFDVTWQAGSSTFVLASLVARNTGGDERRLVCFVHDNGRFVFDAADVAPLADFSLSPELNLSRVNMQNQSTLLGTIVGFGVAGDDLAGMVF